MDEVVRTKLAVLSSQPFIQAFNEELDGMFRDANLPETEAWTAMVVDLRKTKDDRNTLIKENKCVAYLSVLVYLTHVAGR